MKTDSHIANFFLLTQKHNIDSLCFVMQSARKIERQAEELNLDVEFWLGSQTRFACWIQIARIRPLQLVLSSWILLSCYLRTILHLREMVGKYSTFHNCNFFRTWITNSYLHRLSIILSCTREHILVPLLVSEFMTNSFQSDASSTFFPIVMLKSGLPSDSLDRNIKANCLCFGT